MNNIKESLNSQMGQLNAQLSTGKGITFSIKILGKNRFSNFIIQALAAANHIYDPEKLFLSQIIFSAPCFSTEGEIEIHTSVQDKSWEKTFEIYNIDSDEVKIYCKGIISLNYSCIDVEFNTFKAENLIKISDKESLQNIFDLVLLTCHKFLNDNYDYHPFTIEKIEIISQTVNYAFLHVQQKDETFDAAILDEEGNLCIRISGLTFKDFSIKKDSSSYLINWKEYSLNYKDEMFIGYGNEKWDDKNISKIYILYYESVKVLKEQIKNYLIHHNVEDIEINGPHEYKNKFESIHEPDQIYLIYNSIDQHDELLKIIHQLKFVLRSQENKKVVELKLVLSNVLDFDSIPNALVDFLNDAVNNLFEMKISFFSLGEEILNYIPGHLNNWWLHFLTEDHMNNKNHVMLLKNGEIYVPELIPIYNYTSTPENLVNLLNVNNSYRSEQLPIIIKSNIDNIKINDQFRSGPTINKKDKYFSQVSKYIRLSLLNYFKNKNIFLYTDSMYETERLMETLDVIAEFHNFFQELLNILKDEGVLSISGRRIVVSNGINDDKIKNEINGLEYLKRKIFDKYQEFKEGFESIVKYIDNLDDVLQGKHQEKNNIDYNYYNHSYQNYLAEFVHDYIEQKEHDSIIKIIEIGAGDGTAAEILLNKLADDQNKVHYYYTDISVEKLSQAHLKFKDKFHFVNYKLLDIEKDIFDQGFIRGAYDLIIASNVIHKTKKIDSSIQNLKTLLKTNGLLLINEITKTNDILNIIHGVLNDSRHFEDNNKRLNCTPFVALQGWKELLIFNGFKNFKIFKEDNAGHISLNSSIFGAESDGIIKYKY